MWLLLGVWVFCALVTTALMAVDDERDGAKASRDGTMRLILILLGPPTWILVALISLIKRILAAGASNGDQL